MPGKSIKLKIQASVKMTHFEMQLIYYFFLCYTDAGCWSKFQRFFFFIIYNPYVVLFVIICIILNTLCMALDHHDMAKEFDLVLRVANYVSYAVECADHKFFFKYKLSYTFFPLH